MLNTNKTVNKQDVHGKFTQLLIGLENMQSKGYGLQVAFLINSLTT